MKSTNFDKKLSHFGSPASPYIIAEVGNNHLGDIEIAFKSIDAAKRCGADAVKFQLYDPELLITSTEPVLKHVPENTFLSQRERFQHMVLNHTDFSKLAKHANNRGIDFLCTPFDIPSAEFLMNIVPAYKIASGDVSNVQLIDYIAMKNKPVMVSTGLCNQKEVDELVLRLPRERSMILHCIGAYPTPDSEVHLDLIPFYRERYQIPLGFSDHTPDSLASLSAAALGATVIEKHFIIDKNLPGGDRDLSLDESGMKNLIGGIRRVASMKGVSPRKITKSEKYGRSKLRRSMYTKRVICAGETISLGDLLCLRPAAENAHPISEIFASRKIIAKIDITNEMPLTPINSDIY